MQPGSLGISLGFQWIVLISLDNQFNEFIRSPNEQGLVVNNIMNSPIFNIEFVDSTFNS
jgi:hypothetical protein